MARETSQAAYHHLVTQGRLADAQRKVYGALYLYGPATAQEVVRASGYQHAEKRLSELRRKGLVKELGTAKCRETGRKAILWDVTALVEPITPTT